MTLDEAINKYYKPIYSLVYGRSGKDKQFADECSNEIFFLFWLKAEKKIDDIAVYPWLLKTANYKLTEYFRQKKKDSVVISIEDISHTHADGTELVDLIIRDKNILAAAQKLLSLLSDDERQMYEDYFTNNMSYVQIASKMGIHRDTVSKRINIITKKLTDEANKVFGITGTAVVLQALYTLIDR